jgi:hypothetical protein
LEQEKGEVLNWHRGVGSLAVETWERTEKLWLYIRDGGTRGLVYSRAHSLRGYGLQSFQEYLIAEKKNDRLQTMTANQN